jgi:hypothetical protein
MAFTLHPAERVIYVTGAGARLQAPARDYSAQAPYHCTGALFCGY